MADQVVRYSYEDTSVLVSLPVPSVDFVVRWEGFTGVDAWA